MTQETSTCNPYGTHQKTLWKSNMAGSPRTSHGGFSKAWEIIGKSAEKSAGVFRWEIIECSMLALAATQLTTQTLWVTYE